MMSITTVSSISGTSVRCGPLRPGLIARSAPSQRISQGLLPAASTPAPSARPIRASAACAPAPISPPPRPGTLARWLSSPLARSLAACAAAALLLALSPPTALAKAKAAAAVVAAPAAPEGLAGLAKVALSFILHLDVHLGEIVAQYGTATYAILFGIVFAETGLVVTPFLPGDSLLFATGALAALGKLNFLALLAVYIAAATLGDAVNYAVGNYFGSRVVQSALVKKEYIQRTEAFYAEHGGKAVVIARFVPIVRTFAPFVAGVGSMNYAKFATYNVAGAVLWTLVCVGAGFAFGNVPAVQENFSLVVLGIVAVSLLPIAFEVLMTKSGKAGSEGTGAGLAGRMTREGGGLSAGFH